MDYTTGDYTLIISADEDDTEMNCDEVKQFIRDKKLNVYWGYSKNKIHAINRDLEKIDDWDWLVNMSDDMKFIEQGWNEKMLELINKKHTDWFAHFNDGFLEHKLTTMSIMGREYFERFGYIYHPSYGSFSCDAEAMYVAQMLGKYEYHHQVFYKHYHPANTTAVRWDPEYIRANKWGDRDVQTYWNRMKKLFYVNNPDTVPFDVKDQLEKKFNLIIDKPIYEQTSHINPNH